ncbi:TonB family protein [Shewanella sp. UCD-KL12]|uniref:TonB family protein n=1 Tax=Shewanella sp. UCD-KL12 TaxID=1917163 RepID=UPI0015C3A8EB|nr:TonB family protein [Shewanella sp. UCD-KL12]
MSMNRTLSNVSLLGLTLFISSPSFMLVADESSSSQASAHSAQYRAVSSSNMGFSESYKAYKKAVADNNSAEIVKFSAQAYQLGKLKFGDDSIDTANLGLNYASALLQVESAADEAQVAAGKAQAHQLYMKALSVYELEYGEESVETIDPLIGAAQTNSDLKQAKSQFKKAVEIAEDSERPLLLASVQMSAFNGLKNTRFYDRKTRNYALNAFDIYQKNLPEDSILRLETAYTVGLIRMAEGKNSKAIPLFEAIVEQFSKLDYSHPYELGSHARLVELYEGEGDSESSTKHCIAIGSMSPWLDDQEQQPLFRKPPRYPISYAKKGKDGWVQLAFTVDEYGFVTEPKVLDSKGGSGFEKSSLEAVSKWRYAPKFVDGKAVAAENTVQLDFTLEKR